MRKRKKNNIELKKEKERKSMEKLENSCKIVRQEELHSCGEYLAKQFTINKKYIKK